jgi:hypothetical protein
MRTRRSVRNQEILYRELVKPALAQLAPTPECEPVEPLDLEKAFWLSSRAKRQIERDRVAAARKAAIKRALSGS